MSQDTISDSFENIESSKLPTSLNVLTILTIIGCILAFVFEIYGFATAKTSYDKTKEMIESGQLADAPAFVKNMVNEKSLAMQKKRLDNKVPLLVLGLVSAGLCLYGAIAMRKRQKQGYTFWLLGELLPVLSTIIFIGASAFSGFAALFMIFPLVFIILYTVNRKHLIY